LISTRAKGFIAHAGENHYTNIGAFPASVKRIQHIHDGLGAEGVVYFGSVDADFGYIAM
jgi:hypothetical protein